MIGTKDLHGSAVDELCVRGAACGNDARPAMCNVDTSIVRIRMWPGADEAVEPAVAE